MMGVGNERTPHHIKKAFSIRDNGFDAFGA
jgi:hypothetical protein